MRHRDQPSRSLDQLVGREGQDSRGRSRAKTREHGRPDHLRRTCRTRTCKTRRARASIQTGSDARTAVVRISAPQTSLVNLTPSRPQRNGVGSTGPRPSSAPLRGGSPASPDLLLVWPAPLISWLRRQCLRAPGVHGGRHRTRSVLANPQPAGARVPSVREGREVPPCQRQPSVVTVREVMHEGCECIGENQSLLDAAKRGLKNSTSAPCRSAARTTASRACPTARRDREGPRAEQPTRHHEGRRTRQDRMFFIRADDPMERALALMREHGSAPASSTRTSASTFTISLDHNGCRPAVTRHSTAPRRVLNTRVSVVPSSRHKLMPSRCGREAHRPIHRLDAQSISARRSTCSRPSAAAASLNPAWASPRLPARRGGFVVRQFDDRALAAWTCVSPFGYGPTKWGQREARER